MAATFAPLDFDAFHRDELPRRLAAGNGALAAAGAGNLPSLAFRRLEGGAYTYVPRPDGIDVVADDDSADLVIEVADEIWQNIVNELDAAAGLLYGRRARCLRGDAIRWLDWEPALRAMFNGRPVYDPLDVALLDRRGAPLDPEQAFTREDDREDMAHFLRTAGYLLVRNVFGEREVGRFLEEAAELRTEAQKGDKLSWWGKDDRGEDILCRVTRAGAKAHLRAVPTDSRMLALKDLAEEPLEHRTSATPEQAITVIWKNPDMREGLGDLPWHRDCGMGGHAAMCPLLIASVFLTPSSPDAGDLRFLPGSWRAGCGPIDPNHPKAPKGAIFLAQPGDVSLHYGDTMHAAPAPAGSSGGYRISAVTGYTRPGTRPHRGKHYNEVLHSRDDGQIEHLEKVARKS